MPTQRRRALLAALTTLAVSATLVAGSAVADTTPAADFTGTDGQPYQYSPLVVEGTAGSGDLYLGWDFDSACYLGGGIKVTIDQLRSLNRVIKRSGRKAIFTVAPNKASAVTRHLDTATLPHGACDATGLAAQNAVLDSYDA